MEAIRYEPLPNTLFMVRVPVIATYTPEEVAVVGLPTENHHNLEYFNYQAYNNMTTVMLPLTKIIDVYCNGYPISVVDSTDTPKIYEILENYLAGVVTVQQNSVNAAIIKEDRLDYIEKFAEEMFGLNKGNIVKSIFDRTHAKSFGLQLDVMTPQEAKDAAIVKMSKPVTAVNTSKVINRPLSHTSFPYVPEDTPVKHTESMIHTVTKEEFNKKPLEATDNISYVYNTLPDFDLKEVKRKPTYRKSFQL